MGLLAYSVALFWVLGLENMEGSRGERGKGHIQIMRNVPNSLTFSLLWGLGIYSTYSTLQYTTLVHTNGRVTKKEILVVCVHIRTVYVLSIKTILQNIETSAPNNLFFCIVYSEMWVG